MIAKLKQIYDSLPTFTCREGCSWCCGNVPIAPIEILNIAKFIKANKVRIRIPTMAHLSCAFMIRGRCSIYEVRPLYCRLYGVVDDAGMKCPHGCKPSQLLTEDEADVIMAKVFILEEQL